MKASETVLLPNTEEDENSNARRENTQYNLAIATLKDWQSYDLLTADELNDYLAKVKEEYEKDKESEREIQKIIRKAREVVYERDDMSLALDKYGYAHPGSSYKPTDGFKDKDEEKGMREILAKYGYSIHTKKKAPAKIKLSRIRKRISFIKGQDSIASKRTMPGQMSLFDFLSA